MKAETIIALPLILCLALGSTARLSVAQEKVEDASDEIKITAEEEGEAREVAERFLRRMQQTNDLAPLIGEMFVPDYAVRLRQEASNQPLALLSQSAVAEASREELARYQLAWNNSLYLAGLLLPADHTSDPAEDDNDERDAAYYQRVLPPDIIELCKNDPILKVLFEEETKERAKEGQPGESVEKSDTEDTDIQPIRSVEQLRGFTSTLEQASTLARKHLGALSVKPNYLERHKRANEEENWEAERDWMRPRAWMLTKEFYGYPKGTRVICVNVIVYHMDLIRVDGKLKVLALYLDMD